MSLSEEDEKVIQRMLLQKHIEKGGGELSREELLELFVEFMKERKHLGENSNINQKSDIGSGILSDHAKKLHESNVILILRLIDKIEKGTVEEYNPIMAAIPNVMPDYDIWEFSLGDKIEVDLPRERFRFIQKQTLGWNKKLENLIGQSGYVVEMDSKYDCRVIAYFPDILTQTMVYAGVLKKTTKKFRPVQSRWKVGDYVRTKKNKKIVSKFQRRLPDIPDKYIFTERGRVIAVTSAGVFVTFDGRKSYTIHPAALQMAVDRTPILIERVTNHPMNFSVGDKVRVSKDMRKLIENQKDVGGWNWKMSSLAGTIVRICHINEDGSLIVVKKGSRPWRVSYQSVVSLNDPEDSYDALPSDLPFLPGDIVRLRLTSSIKVQLVSAKVLESCIDFLKLPARVEGVNDDYNVVVRFSNGIKQKFHPSNLLKVSLHDSRKFDNMQILKSSITIGSRVRISAGPERYVKEILMKLEAKQSDCEAFTEESELLRFTDLDHAVIKYHNDRLVKIAVKYLTSAEEFHSEIPRKIEFDSLKTLVEKVERCIASALLDGGHEILQNMAESVDIFSVTAGSPPTACLRINSPYVKVEEVIKYLKECTENPAEFTTYCDNEFRIKMINGHDVYVVLLPYEEEKGQVQMMDIPVEESSTIKNTKMEKENVHDDANRRADISNFTEAEQCEIENWADFRFIKIPLSGSTICLPMLPNANSESHTSSRSHSAPFEEISRAHPTHIYFQGHVDQFNYNTHSKIKL